jgi:hypothetical protein
VLASRSAQIDVSLLKIHPASTGLVLADLSTWV